MLCDVFHLFMLDKPFHNLFDFFFSFLMEWKEKKLRLYEEFQIIMNISLFSSHSIRQWASITPSVLSVFRISIIPSHSLSLSATPSHLIHRTFYLLNSRAVFFSWILIEIVFWIGSCVMYNVCVQCSNVRWLTKTISMIMWRAVRCTWSINKWPHNQR